MGDIQPGLFDDEFNADLDIKQSGAKAARDDAIDAVGRNNPQWKARFVQCVMTVAKSGRWFTTDDVFALYPELEACPEKRVLGAAMRQLAADKILVPGNYVESNRTASHARPKRQWRLTTEQQGIDAATVDSPLPGSME